MVVKLDNHKSEEIGLEILKNKKIYDLVVKEVQRIAFVSGYFGHRSNVLEPNETLSKFKKLCLRVEQLIKEAAGEPPPSKEIDLWESCMEEYEEANKVYEEKRCHFDVARMVINNVFRMILEERFKKGIETAASSFNELNIMYHQYVQPKSCEGCGLTFVVEMITLWCLYRLGPEYYYVSEKPLEALQERNHIHGLLASIIVCSRINQICAFEDKYRIATCEFLVLANLKNSSKMAICSYCSYILSALLKRHSHENGWEKAKLTGLFRSLEYTLMESIKEKVKSLTKDISFGEDCDSFIVYCACLFRIGRRNALEFINSVLSVSGVEDFLKFFIGSLDFISEEKKTRLCSMLAIDENSWQSLLKNIFILIGECLEDGRVRCNIYALERTILQCVTELKNVEAHSCKIAMSKLHYFLFFLSSRSVLGTVFIKVFSKCFAIDDPCLDELKRLNLERGADFKSVYRERFGSAICGIIICEWWLDAFVNFFCLNSAKRPVARTSCFDTVSTLLYSTLRSVEIYEAEEKSKSCIFDRFFIILECLARNCGNSTLVPPIYSLHSKICVMSVENMSHAENDKCKIDLKIHKHFLTGICSYTAHELRTNKKLANAVKCICDNNQLSVLEFCVGLQGLEKENIAIGPLRIILQYLLSNEKSWNILARDGPEQKAIVVQFTGCKTSVPSFFLFLLQSLLNEAPLNDIGEMERAINPEWGQGLLAYLYKEQACVKIVASAAKVLPFCLIDHAYDRWSFNDRIGAQGVASLQTFTIPFLKLMSTEFALMWLFLRRAEMKWHCNYCVLLVIYSEIDRSISKGTNSKVCRQVSEDLKSHLFLTGMRSGVVKEPIIAYLLKLFIVHTNGFLEAQENDNHPVAQGLSCIFSSFFMCCSLYLSVISQLDEISKKESWSYIVSYMDYSKSETFKSNVNFFDGIMCTFEKLLGCLSPLILRCKSSGKSKDVDFFFAALNPLKYFYFFWKKVLVLATQFCHKGDVILAQQKIYQMLVKFLEVAETVESPQPTFAMLGRDTEHVNHFLEVFEAFLHIAKTENNKFTPYFYSRAEIFNVVCNFLQLFDTVLGLSDIAKVLKSISAFIETSFASIMNEHDTLSPKYKATNIATFKRYMGLACTLITKSSEVEERSSEVESLLKRVAFQLAEFSKQKMCLIFLLTEGEQNILKLCANVLQKRESTNLVTLLCKILELAAKDVYAKMCVSKYIGSDGSKELSQPNFIGTLSKIAFGKSLNSRYRCSCLGLISQCVLLAREGPSGQRKLLASVIKHVASPHSGLIDSFISYIEIKNRNNEVDDFWNMWKSVWSLSSTFTICFSREPEVFLPQIESRVEFLSFFQYRFLKGFSSTSPSIMDDCEYTVQFATTLVEWYEQLLSLSRFKQMCQRDPTNTVQGMNGVLKILVDKGYGQSPPCQKIQQITSMLR
eukprot:Nk52_evm20s123 gene=Nk52_evmTU20s123